MNKIPWCLKQKDGVSIIELKPHLSAAYMAEADETLENVIVTKGKWKVILAYYACYNAFYSILMKVGIKCEIHDCTIELMPLFGFGNEQVMFMKNLKQDRINNQYYLKSIELGDMHQISMFILLCKRVLNELSSEKIEEIRNNISIVAKNGSTQG